MSENLTLNMDSEVIEFANDFSRKINKPISKIIEEYFIELKEKNSNDLPQDFQELYGIFEGINIPDKNELRRMFHEKHIN
jgi:hypothetical protein